MARNTSIEKKSAAIPYRFWNGELQILLLTTRSSNDKKKTKKKWTIPKGAIAPPLKAHFSAVKETFEEAGALGRLHPICVGEYNDGSNGGAIPTFLLEVDVELDEKNWLEARERSKQWVDADNWDGYNLVAGLSFIINKGVQCLRSSGAYFERAIETFCEEYKLKDYKYKLNHYRFNEKYAELEFTMPNTSNKLLYVRRDGSTIKFAVTDFVFDPNSNQRDAFSTLLLRRNFETKLGFWSMQKVKDGFAYHCVHNAELKLLDSKYFAEIINDLIHESKTIGI